MSENINAPYDNTNPPLPVIILACDVTQLGHPGCDVTQIGETPEIALQALTAQFLAIAKVSDDYAILGALAIKRMRQLVEQGAAGVGVTWYSWAAKLGLPKQRVQRYLRIADAKNPREMRDDFLRQDRERAKKCRAKPKTIDPERQRLIDWSRKAPLAQVQSAWKAIEEAKIQL